MRQLNVALIGVGFMGRGHSNAYRQVTAFLKPRIQPHLKVLCGRDAEKTRALAETFGWDECSTDWRSVVSRPDIDLVDISTPGDTHCEIAVAAAQAGKIVFCEKPLANSLAEAQTMLEAVRKAGVIHMICHNYRMVPSLMLARKLIAEGRLGQIRHFRGTYLNDSLVDPLAPLKWRLQREKAGSGALGDILSHTLDIARFLVGEIHSVCGMLETFVHHRPLADRPDQLGPVTVDDAALCLMRFQNGALGSLEGTRYAPGRKNYNAVEVNGSLGSIFFDMERMNELKVFLPGDDADIEGFRKVQTTGTPHAYGAAWWPTGHLIGYEHTFTHVVYELLEAIADQRIPSPNFEDGVRNQVILDAIARSNDSRTWLDIPGTL